MINPHKPCNIPTVDSFLPVCDIMFPKGVGSLRVSWVLGALESQNHDMYNSPIGILILSSNFLGRQSSLLCTVIPTMVQCLRFSIREASLHQNCSMGNRNWWTSHKILSIVKFSLNWILVTNNFHPIDIHQVMFSHRLVNIILNKIIGSWTSKWWLNINPGESQLVEIVNGWTEHAMGLCYWAHPKWSDKWFSHEPRQCTMYNV